MTGQAGTRRMVLSRFCSKAVSRPGWNLLACALALLIVAAAIPTALGIHDISRLSATIAEIGEAGSQAKQARQSVDQSGQSLVGFAAITLGLSKEERAQVLQETDRQLRNLQQSFHRLDALARRALSAEEYAVLKEKVSSITHNWEEFRNEAESGMEEPEKTFHFMTIFDDTLFMRSMLNRVEALATRMTEDATARSLERVTAAGRFLAMVIALGGALSLLACRCMVLFARSARKANRDLMLANDELRDRDASLKEQNAALVNLPHGLCMFDVENRLVLSNARYAAMYRLPAHLTRPGTPLRDILACRMALGNAPVDARFYLAQNHAVALKAETTTLKCELQDGRTISISHSPMSDGGYVALHENITDAVRFETALAQAKEDAERAQAQAEQANEAKTDFLASMSHEVRTPLNGILGYTDLLLDDKTLNSDQRRQVDRIQSAGAALLTVVDDILDFSKIEAGRIELDPQPFSPAALVDSAASIVKGLADKKRLSIRIEAPRDLPAEVVGDQDRIRQVLLNLLNNAVKFTPSGEVVLSVRTLQRSALAATLHFRVADSGIGIARDKQARLFERFSQVDGSISREFGGTGLGLAISKRLVELMGGRIGVESELGRGAAFWFSVSLPVAEQDGRLEPAEAEEADAGRGVRVLLVEDNEINQEIAGAMLRAAGHDVDIVVEGAAAVMAVQARTYDVVLMDIQMPGMDGIAATQHIRALQHPAHAVPIVALTANVLPQQVALFRAAGMDDHVGKPFKRKDLYAAVERWSNGRRAGRAKAAEAAA